MKWFFKGVALFLWSTSMSFAQEQAMVVSSTPVQSPSPIAVAPPMAPIYVSPYPYPPAYYGPPAFMFIVGVGYHRGYGRHWR